MADPHDPLSCLFSNSDAGRTHAPLDIGELAFACETCGALKFAKCAADGSILHHSIEQVQCCGTHASVVLPDAHRNNPISDIMRSIVDPHALNFDAQRYEVWKTRARSLNACLAFASSQVRECHLAPPTGRNAPPHFLLNGEVQHNIGPIVATPGYTPRFAQMYFWDADQDEIIRTRQRWVHLHEEDASCGVTQRDVDVSAQMLHELQALIQQQHPYQNSIATSV